MSIEARAGPPRATYRLQLTPSFGFDDAAAVVDYLADLGISHVYTSPYLQAVSGSMHGYDVVDPSALNEELGGRAGHARLMDAIRRAGLGHVVDVVPNHMAIVPANPWWWDVLENGASSRYAPYFDIEWEGTDERFHNNVLLPVLGDHYGRVLEAGELSIAYEGGRFTVRYADQAFPLAPRSIDGLLGDAARHARRSGRPARGRTAGPVAAPEMLEFLAGAFAALPPSEASDADSVERRHRDKGILADLLADLTRHDADAAAAIDATVAATNGDIEALDALLQRQNYRLSFWRTAAGELSHRRFFDVTELGGLRAEDPRVFRDTHALVLGLVRAGLVQGLRIDHVDGLRDPQGYLARLRAEAPDAWILVEKILLDDERLRPGWPVEGTTGYDFMDLVDELFVDPRGAEALTALYGGFTGMSEPFDVVSHAARKQVMDRVLGSEMSRLAGLLREVTERHRRHRDYTGRQLLDALRELIAAFDVYRTYVRADAGAVEDEDVNRIEAAAARAIERRQDLADLIAFVRDVLLLRIHGPYASELVMRFQQATGPVMAKGVEDGAFYRYLRLTALNEVGGDPGRFGRTPREFHERNADVATTRPLTMLASTTHDTKRSEDVRARIALLSEIPERWAPAVARWSEMNAWHRRGDLPDRNTEYLLYQTLAGAWPIDRDRILAYMEKAIREAKVRTSWLDPDAGYEDAVCGFVEDVVGDDAFCADLAAFVEPLVSPGRIASLARTLLRLTAPGVPDVYQGAELWTDSLVDPDNRRPVDFERRRALLEEVDALSPEEILARVDDGLPKLWTIRRALQVRALVTEAFAPGASYRARAAEGSRADHVVAFERGERVVTVVPRLLLRLDGGWEDTAFAVPAGAWRNELTGEQYGPGPVAIDELFARFPVALLVRGEPQG